MSKSTQPHAATTWNNRDDNCNQSYILSKQHQTTHQLPCESEIRYRIMFTCKLSLYYTVSDHLQFNRNQIISMCYCSSARIQHTAYDSKNKPNPHPMAVTHVWFGVESEKIDDAKYDTKLVLKHLKGRGSPAQLSERDSHDGFRFETTYKKIPANWKNKLWIWK